MVEGILDKVVNNNTFIPGHDMMVGQPIPGGDDDSFIDNGIVEGVIDDVLWTGLSMICLLILLSFLMTTLRLMGRYPVTMICSRLCIQSVQFSWYTPASAVFTSVQRSSEHSRHGVGGTSHSRVCGCTQCEEYV